MQPAGNQGLEESGSPDRTGLAWPGKSPVGLHSAWHEGAWGTRAAGFASHTSKGCPGTHGPGGATAWA